MDKGLNDGRWDDDENIRISMMDNGEAIRT